MLVPARAAGSLLRRLAGDRRANFAVMTALTAPVALLLTAFAVDEGSLFTERREAQSLADLAAIAAAANIAKAETAALATLRDNGLSAPVLQGPGGTIDVAGGKVSVKVVRGRYTGGAGTQAGRRFAANAEPFNAVEVSLHKAGTLFFGSAFMDPPVIGVKAVAAATPQATFSIGSRLARVRTEDSPLLNSLLGGLLGTSLSLDGMSYNALLDADVEILSFLDALATRLDLTAASYSDVLAKQATIGQIAGVMAGMPGFDQKGRLALQAVAAANVAVPLSRLVDLGPVGKLALGQKPPGLAVEASALDMLMAAAMLANGSRQVAIDTGISVPGLLGVELLLAIGEPPQSSPWLAVGESGAVVRTAQTRLKLVANIGGSTVQTGIKLLSVTVPINVEVAYAEAELTDISCPTGRPESRQVTISAKPGIADAYLAQNTSADFADFTRKQSFGEAVLAKAEINLLIIKIPLLELRAMAHAQMGDTTATRLVFNDNDITAGRVRSVTARDYTQSLTASLLKDLKLTPYVAGVRVDLLDIVFKPLQGAILPLLQSVTSQLDPILFKLLSGLGIGLGQADVRVTGATCGRSVLVQ